MEQRRYRFSFVEAAILLACVYEICGNPPGWYQYNNRRHPSYDYDNAYYRHGAPWIRESNPSKHLPWPYPNSRIGSSEELHDAPTHKVKKDDTIHFPDQDLSPRVLIQHSITDVPKCEGRTFCEEVSNYPEDIVNQAILANESLKHYAVVDEVMSISQRINVNDDSALCVSIEQVVFPKSAENANKTWMFVVNQPNFMQGIRIETCTQESNPCNLIDGFAQGYITLCEQKYIYRKLAAITSDGTVASDLFKFPASCCCHVKFVGHISP